MWKCTFWNCKFFWCEYSVVQLVTVRWHHPSFFAIWKLCVSICHLVHVIPQIILFKQSIHISLSFIIYFNLILVLNVHVKILNERKLCPYACWYWIIEFVFRSVLTRVWAFGMLLHESNLFIKTSFKYSPHFFKFAKRMSLIFTNCQNESRCQDLCCVELTLFQRSLHRWWNRTSVIAFNKFISFSQWLDSKPLVDSA